MLWDRESERGRFIFALAGVSCHQGQLPTAAGLDWVFLLVGIRVDKQLDERETRVAFAPGFDQMLAWAPEAICNTD